ncbi:hypothetical protein COU61_03960 [Candidatus Pacearchaeota archaeon CG10_big_fil_rev_8_21_14_0_10_35_13]|nr:MAG: hypothetical protein COU61_03960 [Candidatus Pacearchaeota archaeon CG10_big_fil_rev_8_21_14_0_10_35_13]
MGKHQKIEFLTTEEIERLEREGKIEILGWEMYELGIRRVSKAPKRFNGTARYATEMERTEEFNHGGYGKVSRIGFYKKR